MAETFDTQLQNLHSREQKAVDQDYADRLKQAEADYEQLSAFCEWLRTKRENVLLDPRLRTSAPEAWVDYLGGYFWINTEGCIFSDDDSADAPWQILWDMYQTQLKGAKQ